MLPPAVVEQQAKLGVSAEESKAQRLQRQQARFRDRGGAFVPSTSNPLVDILLARTVSGESPSKRFPKDVPAKRLSPAKASQASTTQVTVVKQNQAVPGSSKSKPLASRKGKGKAVGLEAGSATKPATKRRRKSAKGKREPPDADSDVEQAPAITKLKSTSKAKGKQRAPWSTSAEPKKKTKTKPIPRREVVEVLVSDDDQTLVEVPRKAKPNLKRNTRYEDDAETNDDVPVVKKRPIPSGKDSKASRIKTATHLKTERMVGTKNSGRKTLQGKEERTQDDGYTETNTNKRLVSDDDDSDDDNVAVPPTKRGKAKSVNPRSAKPKVIIDPAPAPLPAKNIENRNIPKAAVKGRRMGKTEPVPDIVEPVDHDEQPLERVAKPKKRKKEEDNHDDRPRKAVKFTDLGPPHSSSQKLKENRSDDKGKHAAMSNVKDELDTPRPKLATKPPLRTKTLKGPPQEVLERIKASVVQHLRCIDSEPDELDCLS